ncbi:AcrR family transcriptional regulator [Nocardia transvalensis]|uniref:AcrR family transcriptional regulator n=1 Tax=Nocardia transvalensis TaxID=37333 RepID=A0A7W9PFW5_9NOCA|nr:TetR/AcrR family transcriptional regulator [Nocardia transvalensis]MBB5914908.1 AcrR family transcriptional regulator [Nocardia transvalensis]
MTDPHESADSRPVRRDVVRNRQALLAAAKEVYAEQGLGAGVEEIARRAGLGMGTLYRHFPTKKDLLLTLRQEILADMSSRVAATAAAQPPGRRLEACLWTLCAEMRSHHCDRELLWQAFPLDDDPGRPQFWALIGSSLREAQEAGRIRDDLTLTDVFLCVVSVRGLLEDTAERAPDAWKRHLSLQLAGFLPGAPALDYPPADESLVATGLQRRPVTPKSSARAATAQSPPAPKSTTPHRPSTPRS